jgi:hypothetical protein
MILSRRFWVRSVVIVGVIIMLTGVGFSQQLSFRPHPKCPQGTTAAKTQSKLWFNDGAWWGILFDLSSEEFHIYRYDLTTGAWRDTGTLVDGRNTSRADALWEEGHLYVVSAGTEASLHRDSARFLRYSYDPSTNRYSLDEGFPVTITEGGMEAITVARDTTGKLWATYAQNTQDGKLRRVYVTHTLGSDASKWIEPFVPSLEGTTMSIDDVSGIVAFGSKIGLAWSNQYDESGKAGYYFATHADGDPDGAWQPDNIVLGSPMANDHINLKADSEGRVFATLKTRRDRINRDLDAPYSMLWVRDQEGNWTPHVFGTVGDSHTRTQLLIDEEQRLLYMFGTSPTCAGGKIYYKRTDLDDISFEEGRGILLMQGPNEKKIGDATSTKQTIDDTTEALVVASDTLGGTEGLDYNYRNLYYNVIDPRTQRKLFPDGSRVRTDASTLAEVPQERR